MNTLQAYVVTGSSRHIISTTITTFGGFLPLILAGGGYWPPFAVAIAGGVLLSSVVSFCFVPAMFALVYAGKPRATVCGRTDAPPAAAGRLIRLRNWRLNNPRHTACDAIQRAHDRPPTIKQPLSARLLMPLYTMGCGVSALLRVAPVDLTQRLG